MTGAVTYRCPRCDKYLDEAGIKKIPAGSGFMRACTTCGGAIAEERSRVARSMPAVLAGAFMYPFRGSTLLWVGAMILGATFLSFVPFAGGFLAISAELGFLFTVLKSTAVGSDDLQVDLTDLADVSTWLRPLAKYFFAAFISFGPAAAVAYATPMEGGGVSPIATLLAGLGVLYFPAALVLAAHETGCLGVLNPVAGLKLIARIPGAYFLTVFFVAIAIGVGAAMLRVAMMIEVPIAGVLARSVASLYGPVVAMRMLGLLVNENAELL